MRVDTAILVHSPLDAGPLAARIEALGYDGAFTFEGPHDPFLPLLSAAEHTARIDLATAIAVGFARSPMLLANIGYDLQLASRGRFVLGLGSQIRPHIERRFSQPWSKPADRMRELVQAVRAIWAAWQERTRLDFRGEFYTHTLMTPFFDPGPNPYGLPRIFVAGVGPRMTEVAGEVGDGFLVHPFHSREFLERTTLPALERGRSRSARRDSRFEVSCQILVACGDSPDALERAGAAVRTQIAFYASTPAYRPVLECHGHGALQPQLSALAKQGRWAEMPALLPDDLVDAVAVTGAPGEIPDRVRARCGGLAGRVSLVAPYASDPAFFAPTVKALRGAGSGDRITSAGET